MGNPRARRPLKWLILLVVIWSMAGAGGGHASDPLPVRDWNLKNLKVIEALKPGPLTFAVLGDSRDNPAVFGKLLQQIDRDPDIAFAVHLGDMVEKADLAQYQVFFRVVRQNLHKPMVTVMGNHELHGKDSLRLYRDIFGPEDYSFQVKRNFFIAFNDSAKTGLGEEQFRWLAKELDKSKNYQTRVILCHIPLFDPRDGDHPASLPPETARRLTELFQRQHVTQIFAAHKHSYFAGQWDGIPYAISGGAGARLYGTDPLHYFYHYLKVSIRGDQVQIQVRPLEEKGE
jgi:3',5'-cyclic AMP phosphodiesterase CpdA